MIKNGTLNKPTLELRINHNLTQIKSQMMLRRKTNKRESLEPRKMIGQILTKARKVYSGRFLQKSKTSMSLYETIEGPKLMISNSSIKIILQTRTSQDAAKPLPERKVRRVHQISGNGNSKLQKTSSLLTLKTTHMTDSPAGMGTLATLIKLLDPREISAKIRKILIFLAVA